MDYTDWFPQMTIVGVVANLQLNSLDRNNIRRRFGLCEMRQRRMFGSWCDGT
jgi:hypothetical protein